MEIKNEKLNNFVKKGKVVIKESIAPLGIFGLCMGCYLLGKSEEKKQRKAVLKLFDKHFNSISMYAPKDNEKAADYMRQVSKDAQLFLEETNNNNISMNGFVVEFKDNNSLI